MYSTPQPQQPQQQPRTSQVSVWLNSNWRDQSDWQSRMAIRIGADLLKELVEAARANQWSGTDTYNGANMPYLELTAFTRQVVSQNPKAPRSSGKIQSLAEARARLEQGNPFQAQQVQAPPAPPAPPVPPAPVPQAPVPQAPAPQQANGWF